MKYEKMQRQRLNLSLFFDQIATMYLVEDAIKPGKKYADSELKIYKQNAERFPSSLGLLRYAYAAGLNGQPQAAAHTLQLL